MKLHGGIDLHSNNNVVALLDEEDRVLYRKRWPVRSTPGFLRPRMSRRINHSPR
jgi:predicted NBD/HSP70 family sugar kinase